MKLYDVPRNTQVKSIEPDCSDEFKLINIDGMYSYCTKEWYGNETAVHIAAWTDVEILDK